MTQRKLEFDIRSPGVTPHHRIDRVDVGESVNASFLYPSRRLDSLPHWTDCTNRRVEVETGSNVSVYRAWVRRSKDGPAGATLPVLEGLLQQLPSDTHLLVGRQHPEVGEHPTSSPDLGLSHPDHTSAVLGEPGSVRIARKQVTDPSLARSNPFCGTRLGDHSVTCSHRRIGRVPRLLCRDHILRTYTPDSHHVNSMTVSGESFRRQRASPRTHTKPRTCCRRGRISDCRRIGAESAQLEFPAFA